MPDSQTRQLDQAILKFVSRYPGAMPDGAFEALAMRLFEFQFARNSFYRRLCEADGKRPGKLAGWKEIPAMPTAAFKELVLTTFPMKKAVRVFRTSGTTSRHSTGQVRDGRGASAIKTSADAPRGAHFFETLKLYDVVLAPVFRRYLLPDGARCRFFFLMQSPAEAPHSSLSYMMGAVNRRFSKPRGKFYVRGGEARFEELVKDLKAVGKNKVMILATAFSLKSFLDFLEAKNISLKLPAGSRLMETGGFKGRMKEVSKKELYSGCRRRLGISPQYCVSEYGMTELTSQFYDTTLRDHVDGVKRRSYKEGPPWLRTVVIDPVTRREAKKGRPGLLRHFDLANRGSVMAIQTEDIGRAVGNGFEVIGRASGAEIRGCSLTYEALLRT